MSKDSIDCGFLFNITRFLYENPSAGEFCNNARRGAWLIANMQELDESIGEAVLAKYDWFSSKISGRASSTVRNLLGREYEKYLLIYRVRESARMRKLKIPAKACPMTALCCVEWVMSECQRRGFNPHNPPLEAFQFVYDQAIEDGALNDIGFDAFRAQYYDAHPNEQEVRATRTLFNDRIDGACPVDFFRKFARLAAVHRELVKNGIIRSTVAHSALTRMALEMNGQIALPQFRKYPALWNADEFDEEYDVDETVVTPPPVIAVPVKTKKRKAPVAKNSKKSNKKVCAPIGSGPLPPIPTNIPISIPSPPPTPVFNDNIPASPAPLSPSYVDNIPDSPAPLSPTFVDNIPAASPAPMEMPDETDFTMDPHFMSATGDLGQLEDDVLSLIESAVAREKQDDTAEPLDDDTLEFDVLEGIFEDHKKSGASKANDNGDDVFPELDFELLDEGVQI